MKASELLKAKLLIPPVRQGSVARAQLLAQLDECLYRKLALVSAPAGYGKTTLLSAWAQQVGQKRQIPIAWLSLDEGDNDPISFIRYFCASFQEINLSFADYLLELIQTNRFVESGIADSIEAFQTDLLNQLQAIPDPIITILDDFHLITTQPIHQFVAFLLDQLPPQMHLVIASRADPPLPLPRLRASDQLVEIRLDQLRFTTDEATALLEHFGRLHLAMTEIAALTDRTEGWVAGLQMAALAMQGRADLAKYLQDFTGSNRYILDYLIEEVLDRQPEAIQDFLLKTSILKRMSAPLCEALIQAEESEGLQFTRTKTAEGILGHLERANLFLIPLDDRREWYRYHHLFADLLRKRLNETRADLVPILHQRAGRWLTEHEMVAEAIYHAFKAGNSGWVADLLERSAEEFLALGEVATLLGWTRRLSSEFIQSRPRLDLYYVTSLVLLNQDREAIETGLNRLSHQPDLAYETDVLRAYQAVHALRLPIVEKLAQKALAGLPENAVFFRRIANWLLDVTQELGSELNQRIGILEEMIQNARSIDNRMGWVSALCALADVRFHQTNLALARDLYQEAIQVSTTSDGRLLPIAGEALIGLGHLLREWNELEQASHDLEQGIELIRQVRETGVIEGLIGLSVCRQAQGDAIGARRVLEQAHRIARAVNATHVYDRIVDFYEALILHKQGDNQAILLYFEKWAAGKDSATGKDAQVANESEQAQFEAQLRKYEQVALARSCLTSQKPNETLATLDELLPEMTRQGQKLLVAEIELLRARALALQGNPKEAQIAFESSLAIAELGGLVRLFIDEGPAIIPFLQKTLQRNTSAPYVQRLLDLFLGSDASQTSRIANPENFPALPGQPGLPRQVERGSLLEPLSSRELEVLTYLVNRLSAKEIANQLSVAESTVNSHINSIYGKLGVHRRLDAIQKAKALGLI